MFVLTYFLQSESSILSRRTLLLHHQNIETLCGIAYCNTFINNVCMFALTADLSTKVAPIRTCRIWFIWNFMIIYEKVAKQVCGGWGLGRLYCRTLKKWDHGDWSEMQWLYRVEVHFMTSWRYILFTELRRLSNRDHYGTIMCEANKHDSIAFSNAIWMWVVPRDPRGPTRITWRKNNTEELITTADFRYSLVQDVQVPDVDSCCEIFTPTSHACMPLTVRLFYLGI